MSIANHIRRASRASLTLVIVSSASCPAAAARAASIARIPWPPQAERLSQTVIRSPPLPSSTSWSRACVAESTVPEMPDEMWIETTSRPAASSGS